MPIAQFPANWLQALCYADKSRLTRLAYQYILTPGIVAGGHTVVPLAIGPNYEAAIVYDIRPSAKVTPNVWTWAIRLAGDEVIAGPVTADVIRDGMNNILFVTQHEPLSIYLRNGGAITDTFEGSISYVLLARNEDMEVVKAYLRQLGDTSRLEELLSQVRDEIKELYNKISGDTELQVLAPEPPLTVQELEVLRRQA